MDVGTSDDKVTLQALVSRATGGKQFSFPTVVSASRVYQLQKQPWWIWAHFHAPKDQKHKTETPFDEYKMNLGVDFGKAFVRERHPDSVAIPGKPWETAALVATIRAMMNGAPAIAEGVLWNLETGVYGAADVLVRSDEHDSDLGPYHYRVGEVKYSPKVAEYAQLQAALLSRILGKIQGYDPPVFEVHLKDGTTHPATTADYKSNLEGLMKLLEKLRTDSTEPDRPGFDDGQSPWKNYCNERLREKLDIVLMPNVGPAKRQKFQAAFGTTSIRNLYGVSKEDFVRHLSSTKGIWVHSCVKAYQAGAPVLLPGRSLDIPQRERRLYYDFENVTPDYEEEPPHVYMIGIYDPEKDDFQCLVTDSAGDEERIFREFREIAGDPAEVALYHWHDHETRMMNSDVRGRHPELAPVLDDLIAASVDLKACIKDSVALPVPTYSIKQVAPLAGFHWSQGDVDGRTSQILYHRSRVTGDRGPINKVIQYNKEDCLSMVAAERWIREQVASREGNAQ